MTRSRCSVVRRRYCAAMQAITPSTCCGRHEQHSVLQARCTYPSNESTTGEGGKHSPLMVQWKQYLQPRCHPVSPHGHHFPLRSSCVVLIARTLMFAPRSPRAHRASSVAAATSVPSDSSCLTSDHACVGIDMDRRRVSHCVMNRIK
eukprot:TRINITY_DN31098_c0_g1_i2.p1 TRINITY_DN31098_c0_g1~~TRINITY_DN31098_c0_g1_i2.p1  ORF type:complete len:147 (-),score=1.15 TRINITY_DN31098_c0_g1_i2:661-1101(-)